MTKLAILMSLFLTAALLAQQGASPNLQPGPADDAYRLQAGDAIEVRFYFNPELNDGVQIRPDGRISLNLIGEVKVAGLTIAEATALISQLALKEIATPSVTIQVRSFAGLKVFVTGEVLRPGPIGLPGQMTLLQAIGEAGGRKPTAAKTIVLIRKNEAGLPEGHRMNPFQGDNAGPDAGMLLQPFDVIMVPETRVTRVDRWVDQHIKQINPVILSGGFTYLFQRNTSTPSTTGLVPIF
jgi:polysaccharide biosynthesis/export protein PslD